MDAQRALLDELMGSARNLTEEERRGHREITWDDKEVCGFYMVKFCPHDLFVNTRSDLGPCPKIHDPKLKESFENSPRHDPYVPRFEAELAHFCEKLVMDLDRKVRRGRERLAQEVEVPPPPPVPTEKSEQLAVLEEKIKNLLESVEALGEAGKVDEAGALMRKVDLLNIEKTALTLQSQNDKLTLAQEKKMALCETCGSFLIANDALERTQSHVTGKQHIGYGLVRDFLSEYKVVFPDKMWQFQLFIHEGVFRLCFISNRNQRRRQGKRKGWLGRKKQMKEGNKEKKKVKVVIEMDLLTWTIIVTSGTATCTGIETLEGIVIQEEDQIVGTIITIIIIIGMGETGTGIDTVNVTVADPVHLLGMGGLGHPEVHISENSVDKCQRI
ncbi:hypothetical protein R6Q57_013261 [Mikania cordata]